MWNSLFGRGLRVVGHSRGFRASLQLVILLQVLPLGDILVERLPECLLFRFVRLAAFALVARPVGVSAAVSVIHSMWRRAVLRGHAGSRARHRLELLLSSLRLGACLLIPAHQEILDSFV